MITVSGKSFSSSDRRITPIRPSIMSDGPRMSQPASAWTSAIFSSASRVSSFSTTPSRTSPSCPSEL